MFGEGKIKGFRGICALRVPFSSSYCVGGRHRSATKNICEDITSKGTKILIDYCSIYDRKESITVSGNTIQAERISEFSKTWVKKTQCSKKLAKIVLKNPGSALDITANIATAAASRNLKAALLTLPELINF